ncbi:hypothetical protein EK21DRAFT_70371 [Setomelanomma holmii]|uniref:Uncharacterized protein n=1 Tax=Setomelanomma holmii TaxID=210430 RepID=A0A9P4H6M1_9PLEO|nr:hypothetical protein EK21DRAFT_70371 [Setomelanomma holmii]
MELLIHLTQDISLFDMSGVYNDHAIGLAVGLREALKAPYLMHALLGFSAQHLAYLYPHRSAHFLRQAVSMQTRAVSLLNASWTDVNESNCVTMLLFSSILGHQLLAETFHKRDDNGLEGFMARYVQCINTHRGIYHISKAAWGLIISSDIGPIVSRSAEFTSRDPVGHDCQMLKRLVDDTVDLTENEKEACQRMIDYLQVGFDALAETWHTPVYRHQMIYSWTLLVWPELNKMLAEKRPEALIILAYYSVLLYFGKALWQVGDVGEYLFGLIKEHLGTDWDHWLQFPREQITGNASS